MAVSNPTQFVSVPFEELKNLMEMARGVAKRSPFGTVDTQPWNPDMTVLPELGNSLPTIAGVVGETNTILISLPDLELIKRLLPVIGPNGNWWVNGEDTGISALADSSKIMRPQFLIRPPMVTGSELNSVITVSGGIVTVDNGTDKVLEIPIQTATLNIAGMKMATVDSSGVIHLYDSKLPVAGHVPILYFKHEGGVVDVPAEVEIAMSAQELAYYVTALRTLDADYFDAYKQYIENAIAQIQAMLDSASSKLVGIPRFMCVFTSNDNEFEPTTEVCYFVADHDFKFKNNFEGSKAKCKLKSNFAVLPQVAQLAVKLNRVAIGSIAFDADTLAPQFNLYQQEVLVVENDEITLEVDSLVGVKSVYVALAHILL